LKGERKNQKYGEETKPKGEGEKRGKLSMGAAVPSEEISRGRRLGGEKKVLLERKNIPAGSKGATR